MHDPFDLNHSPLWGLLRCDLSPSWPAAVKLAQTAYICLRCRPSTSCSTLGEKGVDGTEIGCSRLPLDRTRPQVGNIRLAGVKPGHDVERPERNKDSPQSGEVVQIEGMCI